jgi:hypothetical protein
MLRRRCFVMSLLLSVGCAPRSADRATLTDALAPLPDARPATGPDGMGGMVSSPPDARDSAAPRDTAIDRLPPDRPVDRAPDTSPPPADGPVPSPSDAGEPGDAAGEAPGPVTVLLVVGNPAMLSPSDTRVRTLLEARDLAIRIVDDNAAADASGAALVVLAGSCASDTLAGKYRDVPVPLLNLEPAVQDSLGMTAGAAADLGEQEAASTLSVVMNMHPMAAGLTGSFGVVSTASSFGWGRPPAGAQRVVTIQGMANRVAVYGYTAGAMMVGLTAPARRVGFFAADDSARYLGPNGVRLFNAAIDWALTQDPPGPSASDR